MHLKPNAQIKPASGDTLTKTARGGSPPPISLMRDSEMYFEVLNSDATRRGTFSSETHVEDACAQLVETEMQEADTASPET
jgi:hypothetical protein